MNDKQLGEALLKLDAASLGSVPDTQKLTWQILERDRRRLRWWTILAILAWAPAVLLIVGVLVFLGLLFPLQAKLQNIRDVQRAERAAESDAHAEDHDIHLHHGREIDLAQLERDTEIGFKQMVVLTALAVLALSLAVLASLLLTFASRRATLRQINASLLVISQQLQAKR